MWGVSGDSNGGGGGGGFGRKPSCQICGSTDPSFCMCEKLKSNNNGGGGHQWGEKNKKSVSFQGAELNRGPKACMPSEVCVIVDNHIYGPYKIDGRPIGHIVEEIVKRRAMSFSN